MKKITLVLFTSIAFLFVQQAAAQSLKEIMRQKKEEMAAKAKWKADQKVSEGMDKAIDAPGEAIKKSKEKKKNGKTKTKVVTEDGTVTETMEPPAAAGSNISSKGTQTVIQTNITCESGRKKMEALLKKKTAFLMLK